MIPSLCPAVRAGLLSPGVLSDCLVAGWQGVRGEALETLLAIEKVQRLAEDVTGTRLACQAILEVLFDAKDWSSLNEHIILLSKRRSQLKQVRSISGGTTVLLLALRPSSRAATSELALDWAGGRARGFGSIVGVLLSFLARNCSPPFCSSSRH